MFLALPFLFLSRIIIVPHCSSLLMRRRRRHSSCIILLFRFASAEIDLAIQQQEPPRTTYIGIFESWCIAFRIDKDCAQQ